MLEMTNGRPLRDSINGVANESTCPGTAAHSEPQVCQQGSHTPVMILPGRNTYVSLASSSSSHLTNPALHVGENDERILRMLLLITDLIFYRVIDIPRTLVNTLLINITLLRTMIALHTAVECAADTANSVYKHSPRHARQGTVRLPRPF